uniref:EOG090X026K n=2 Tax=Daphnia magna TaxID=35525 RepID=A0A0P6AYR2_9CRUS|nr:EOG090X026K [Daphnia magna]SVE82946.1 EOG090X026K [Daphnia magna]
MADKLARAEKAIETNPFDLEAWGQILREAQIRKIDDARVYFERLVAQFPTSGRYWKMYIEQEMRARNYDKVEKLFQRCLIKVLNIELWKLYVNYVKETKSALPNYREKIAQCYDFTLDKVGMDIQSYSIWNDYIHFLRNVEAVGSYAENQRITAVRKVYQRGVITPMLNIEQLWKDYIAYELAINPMIAEKMQQERSRDYMNARRVAKELEACTRGLNKAMPSTPPSNHPEQIKQVELWKKYLAWEKSNPLRTEDQSLLTKRTMFAFEQCLLCLGHHPHVWYEAALFLQISTKTLSDKGDVTAAKSLAEEVSNIYERSINGPMSHNSLLYFAYADYEEGRIKYDKAHQIYTKYLEQHDIDPTLGYIQYMRFARRAEGIKSARLVFKRSRQDPRCSSHVFVAAALMEYYCTKDKNIAFKIFDLGLKRFKHQPDYLLAYVEFLTQLNEDNNTRVLFERILSSGSLTPENSLEIWNRFLEFESSIGDLSSVVKVEKRRNAVLDKLKELEGKETALLIDRYRFGTLFPCSTADLRALGYYEVAELSSSQSAKNLLAREEENRKQNTEAADVTMYKPDFSQMVPFKPKIQWTPGEHIAPGGGFPLPPAASQLCGMLPPPHCFHGPFVVVDPVMELIKHLNISETSSLLANTTDNAKLFDMARSVHWLPKDAGVDRPQKKRGMGEESEDEEPIATSGSQQSGPPLNDIYRKRQQKRVK